MAEPLLQIQNVTKVFGEKSRNRTTAMRDVSLTLAPDHPATLAVVGESGSGKTTLANHILGFMTPTSGMVRYKGMDLTGLDREQAIAYRREVQAIFQNPFEAFNPFYTVDHVFHLAVRKFHLANSRAERRELMEGVLRQVRLEPDNVLGKHVHQLSGGQLQRMMIARAMLLSPTILVADEPVSMIDASLRITVLDIMERLKEENRISQVYITHDLSTALQISDTIMVMYRGCVVEQGDARKVIETPAHPYTRLLINCIPLPSPDEKWDTPVGPTLREEAGDGGDRCCFYARCPHGEGACLRGQPALERVEDGHQVACRLCTGGQKEDQP